LVALLAGALSSLRTTYLSPLLTSTDLQLALGIFTAGWYGAERVFFQLHLARRPVSLRHLLGLVEPFVVRFVVLGLLFGLTLLTFLFVAVRILGTSVPLVGGVALIVGVDFLLTFVTPALAYSTRSVPSALSIGLTLIRQTWPRSALYVLCPPLALNVLNYVFPVGGVIVHSIVTAAVVLTGLLAKGAVAAFYLRERGSYSEDGAAYIGPEPAASTVPA
jgi:hypothetical protein